VINPKDRRRLGRVYYHWGVLVDIETFELKKITAKPLFCGLGARGIMPGFLYVMSVIKRADYVCFFNGEGDAYVSYRRIPVSTLQQLWLDPAEV
jgi:hypothetical protein